jgi:hypothetical protein
MSRRPGFTRQSRTGRPLSVLSRTKWWRAAAIPLPSGSKRSRKQSRHWSPRCMLLGYWEPAVGPSTSSHHKYGCSSACLVAQTTERLNSDYTAFSARALRRESGPLTAWPRSYLLGAIRSILFGTPKADRPTQPRTVCFHKLRSGNFGRSLIAFRKEQDVSFPPFAAGRIKGQPGFMSFLLRKILTR